MLPQYALLFAPLVDAWTFRFTNGTNATDIRRGDEEQGCTNSTIAQDRLFTWDPEGSKLCVSIYRDIECTSRAGYSCPIWRKNASADFSAFDVMMESEIIAKSKASELSLTQTSTSSSLPSSTLATSVSASATPTPSATAVANAGSSSGSSLSGGAIAGVVIGVVAAVIIIVALVVLYMKRKNKQNAAAPEDSYGPHEVDATGSSVSGTTVVTEKDATPAARHAFRPPAGSRVVELPGDEGTAELGSSPISEMDAQSSKKFDRS